MAPHSSTLAWKIPWTEEPGGLQSIRLLGVGHDWATSLSLFTFMHWRREWQPIPVFCLENPIDGWAAVYGVTQSRTRLKRLSSSSSSSNITQRIETSQHNHHRVKVGNTPVAIQMSLEHEWRTCFSIWISFSIYKLIFEFLCSVNWVSMPHVRRSLGFSLWFCLALGFQTSGSNSGL